MNCIEIDLLLQRYFDGELSPVKAGIVRRHLHRCSSCTREFDKVRREMRDLIVDVGEPRMDLDLLHQIIAREVGKLRPRHPLPLAPFLVTASLILAVGLGVALFHPREIRTGSPSSSIPLLMGTVTLEEDARIDEGSVPQLLRGSAIFSVPEQQDSFLLHVGGRQVVSEGGRFRVALDDSGNSFEILVFDGSLRVEGGEVRVLREGQAGRFTSAHGASPAVGTKETAQPTPASGPSKPH